MMLMRDCEASSRGEVQRGQCTAQPFDCKISAKSPKNRAARVIFFLKHLVPRTLRDSADFTKPIQNFTTLFGCIFSLTLVAFLTTPYQSL